METLVVDVLILIFFHLNIFLDAKTPSRFTLYTTVQLQHDMNALLSFDIMQDMCSYMRTGRKDAETREFCSPRLNFELLYEETAK